VNVIARSFALVATLALAGSGLAQEAAPRDTVRLSLGEALSTGLRHNPRVLQAGFTRAASGAGVWDAWGNLLPQFSGQGQIQHADEGTFALVGGEFRSPESFTTVFQWDLTHSLLDSGRDLFRIKAARGERDRTIAAFQGRALETEGEIKSRYLETRRAQARERQARREIERLERHLELAERRLELGEVTRSDVLQARVELSRSEVARLEAAQQAEDARLALRRLLGGALPPGAIVLTTDFEPFEPRWSTDDLVRQAVERHPEIERLTAQETVDSSNLWIARSSYLPGLQVQYSLTRTVVDSFEFRFSDFSDRNFIALSLNWVFFDRFERMNQTSRASAALRSTRAERDRIRLDLEERVRSAHGRLRTAWATYRANALSVELAAEDLRLFEERYRVGASSFLDLLDSRVRLSQAETDLIESTYAFFDALTALEVASGFELFPEESVR